VRGFEKYRNPTSVGKLTTKITNRTWQAQGRKKGRKRDKQGIICLLATKQEAGVLLKSNRRVAPCCKSIKVMLQNL